MILELRKQTTRDFDGSGRLGGQSATWGTYPAHAIDPFSKQQHLEFFIMRFTMIYRSALSSGVALASTEIFAERKTSSLRRRY
jgi:hypothetical protein